MIYKAVVIGTSYGGMSALKTVLPALPANFCIPVIIVQHIGASSDSFWITMLDNMCPLHVKEAEEKEPMNAGTVYIAPPNYHLLVERDGTFSLSLDERVSFARPSIDVLFETAALAYGPQLIGIVLTGANYDGTQGLKMVKEYGGLTIVQDPATAESPYMPASALNAVAPAHVLQLEEIPPLLIEKCKL